MKISLGFLVLLMSLSVFAKDKAEREAQQDEFNNEAESLLSDYFSTEDKKVLTVERKTIAADESSETEELTVTNDDDDTQQIETTSKYATVISHVLSSEGSKDNNSSASGKFKCNQSAGWRNIVSAVGLKGLRAGKCQLKAVPAPEDFPNAKKIEVTFDVELGSSAGKEKWPVAIKGKTIKVKIYDKRTREEIDAE